MISSIHNSKTMGHKTKRKILFIVIVVALVALTIILWPKKSIAPIKVGADVLELGGPSPLAGTVPEATRTPSLSWPSGQTISAKILMYHHVGPLPSDADDIRRGLTVSAENFEKQLSEIKQKNLQVVTLAELYAAVAKGEDSSKMIVLTFDDGYDDNFAYALPALQKFDYKGTFFIISGKIDESEYMSEAQVKELAAAGNEIGSHTVTHPSLEKLSAAKLKTELEDSKATLEKLTDSPIISLCYPAGKFSDEVEAAAKSAGYKIAVTTQAWKPFSTDNPFEVPRYRVNPGTNLENLL